MHKIGITLNSDKLRVNGAGGEVMHISQSPL